jgi:branched-chain amino acid transport system substrate-binding protein
MLLRLLAAIGLVFLTIMPSKAADPIQLYAILSLTGPGAFIGQADQKAVELALDVVNKSGGLKGRQLKVTVLDDASNPQNAVQLAGTLIGKTPFIIGPAVTASCAAVAPMLRNGPVSYCLSPGVNPPAGSFYFSAGSSSDDLIVVMMRYFREKGWKRIGFITSTDATGQAVDRGMAYAMNLLENRSMTLVTQEHFGLSDVSVAAQISRIKAANPDAIVAWANGPAFGTVLRGIQDSGLSVPIGASAGNLVYTFLKQFGPLLAKETYFAGASSLSPDFTPPGKQRDAQLVLAKAYANAGLRPDFLAVSAWDPIMILVDALKALGPDASPEQIRNHIATLHGWVGVSGTYDYRDGSQRGIGQSAVMMDRYDVPTDKIVGISRPAGYLR